MSDFSLQLLQENATLIINEETEIEQFNKLLEQNISINIHKEKVGWDNIIFQKNDQHVRYHREASPFGEIIDSSNSSFDELDYLVCIGSGFGYQFHNMRHIFSKIPRVIIADPLFDSLFVFLSTIKLSNILPENVRILFAPRPQILTATLKKTVYRYHAINLGITGLESMKTLAPGYLEEVHRDMQTSWKHHSIFLHTEEDQHAEIRSNVSNNLRQLSDITTLSSDSASGNRALLVGSGPSLEHLLPLIEKVQKKVSLIAAGSALPILLTARILPGYCASGCEGVCR